MTTKTSEMTAKVLMAMVFTGIDGQLALWAVNTLFNMGIPYQVTTWAASAVLLLVLKVKR